MAFYFKNQNYHIKLGRSKEEKRFVNNKQ